MGCLPLLAVAHRNDALALPVPGQVTNRARDDVEFTLSDKVGADAVPDADLSRGITGGDIVARRGEAGDGYGGGVAGVLDADGRVIDGAEKDGFARLGELVWRRRETGGGATA